MQRKIVLGIVVCLLLFQSMMSVVAAYPFAEHGWQMLLEHLWKMKLTFQEYAVVEEQLNTLLDQGDYDGDYQLLIKVWNERGWLGSFTFPQYFELQQLVDGLT